MEYIWSITGRCNLKCKYCWDPYKDTSEMSYEDCCKLIDRLLCESCDMLIFTGGEPTLRIDFFNIVNYAYNKGIRNLKMCTNGYNISSIKNYLLESKINEIHISVNKADDILHRKDFKEFTETISELKKSAIKIVFVSIIDAENINNYISVLELAKKMDINVIFQFMAKTECIDNRCLSNLDNDRLKVLFKEIEFVNKKYKEVIDSFTLTYYDTSKKYYLFNELPKYCYADKKFRIISPNGNIIPCYWKHKDGCDIKDCFTDKCLVWFRYNKRLENIYKLIGVNK